MYNQTGRQNSGSINAIHIQLRPGVVEGTMGTLGHQDVLSTGESLHTCHQKTGERRAKDVLGECSCEWQAGQNPGIFYQDGIRTTGSLRVEGVVRYMLRLFCIYLQ